MKILKYSVLLSSIAIVSCINFMFETPSVSITSIKGNQSLQGMKLDFGLEVYNPNRYNLKLKNFNYRIFMDGEEIAKGQVGHEILLPGKMSSHVEIPLQTDMKFLGKHFSSLIRGKELRYKIEGSAVLAAFLGERKFDFDKEGNFSFRGVKSS